MAGSQGDKQVKVTAVVDKRSFDQANTLLRSLTSEVKKLAEASVRASQGMGSLMGGLTGKATGAGSQGGINSQSAIKTSSPLNFGVGVDTQAVSKAARASTEALNSVTRSMRSNFSGQVSEIERLKRELGSLENQYERLKRVAAGAAPGSRSASRAGSLMVSNELEQGVRRSQIEGHLEARNAEMAARDPMTDGGVPSSRAPGGRGGGAGPGLRGFGGLVNQGMSALGMPGVGGLLSSAGGLGGGLLAGAAAGIPVGGYMAGAASANEMSTARFRLENPMYAGRLGARIGGSVGALGMGIRGGDLASSLAYEGMLSSNAFGNQVGSRSDANRLRLGMENAGMAGTLGDTAGRVTDAIGRKISGGLNMTQMRMGQETQAIPAKKAEEMAEMIRNEVASNPQVAAMYNAAVGGAAGNVNLAWTGGLGMGLNKFGTNTRLAEFKARTTAAGYDPGAVAGARAALGAQAGRGLMGAGQQMLGLGFGGFGNAGQVYGMGAQFGGAGGAQGLLQAAMGGGDTTAMSQIAGMVASGMGGGNFMGSSGSSLMEAMQAVGRTGSVGGDMRMARMMPGGMGEFGRNLSGGTDALQGGINMLAANASGAQGWYAKKALMGMGPEQMIEAMRSGKLPQYLQDQGLSMGNVQSYNKFRNQYSFSRYMDQEGAGTAVGAAVGGVKAAGGVAEYLRQRGVTAQSKEGQRILEQLGTARMATEGGSLESNVAALNIEMGQYGDLTPAGRRRGRGVGLGKGTIEEADARRRGELESKQGEFEAERYEKIRAGITRMTGNSEHLQGLTANLVKGASDFDSALKTMTSALVDALDKIDPKGAVERHRAAAALRRDAEDSASAPGGSAHFVNIPKVRPPRR